MNKKKRAVSFFIDLYKRIKIPWWLYLLALGCGLVYAEIMIRVAGLLIRVNKGELYNSVILGYVLLTVLNAAVAFVQNLFTAYGDQKVIFRIRMALWKRILGFSVKTVDEEQPSHLISAMINDVEEASQVIRVVFSLISSLYGFFRAGVAMYIQDAALTMYLLLLIPVAVLVFVIVGKLQYNIMERRYASLDVMTAFFAEHLSAGKYMKAHSMEEKEAESGYLAIDQRYRADIYYAFMSAVQVLVNSVYTVLTTVVIAVGGSGRIRSGKLEKTGINTFSTYKEQVNLYLAELLTEYQTVKGSQGALSHVNRLMDTPGEGQEEGAEWKEGQNKDIVFSHVCFGYGKENTITDLSFCIPYGKTTALIGDNGCGKSTVLKLMQGFYQPGSGEIWIGENQTGQVKIRELREKFGYVLQDNPLFAGSIRDNIIYGLKNGNIDSKENLQETDRQELEQRMYKAAECACADEFIRALSQGYETEIGEQGNQLSGGQRQRQRIAIARTMMTNPEYLLLDEAGASLDCHMYQKIFQSLREYQKNQTVVFISHDMRQIKQADYVIVLNRGKLEAAGTCNELEKISPTYREYAKRQFREGA